VGTSTPFRASDQTGQLENRSSQADPPRFMSRLYSIDVQCCQPTMSDSGLSLELDPQEWLLRISVMYSVLSQRSIANHIANKSNEMLDAGCYDILVNL
jgi:membrane carboxypeptidase/penicillin-binding protein PbpC